MPPSALPPAAVASHSRLDGGGPFRFLIAIKEKLSSVPLTPEFFQKFILAIQKPKALHPRFYL